MNLSQDEINALTAEAEDTNAADSGGDIMSPEAIAAMLAESEASSAAPAAEDTSVAADSGGDIMSPEAIAAMLAESEGGVSAPVEETPAPEAASEAPVSEDTGGDMMSPEAIAAMLADAEGVSGASEPASSESEEVSMTETVFEGAPPLEGMLTAEEIDILGEVGNISMGAVATTMYSLLDKRVSITTPHVTVHESKNVLSEYQIPFVIATIEYTQGIEGTNLLVLKVEDAAMITDILMGGDGKVEPPIELNEMHLSAMSEIMNQMMGASSTSLSKLLGKAINIDPPKSTSVDAGFDVTGLLGNMDKVTKISFSMEIEGLLKSVLIQLTPYEVSREFAKQFMSVDAVAEAAGITRPAAPPAPAPAPAAAPAPAPAPAAAAPPMPQPQPQAAPFTPPPAPAPAAQPMPYPQVPPVDPYGQVAAQGYPPMYQQPAPMPGAYPMQGMPPPGYGMPPMQPSPMAGQGGRVVDVHPASFQSFDTPPSTGEAGNIGLVYNIPLQVSVELGKTKKEISEILEFSLGTIIVLDKIAGDPVEIVVNGKLLARGEVVVIDDNYGVRITDIVNG